MTRTRAGTRRAGTLVAGAAALVAVLAGCGGASDDGDPGAAGTTSPAASATPSAPADDDGSDTGAAADGGPAGDSPGGGDAGDGDPGDGPPPGDDGWPADPCGTGEFGVGTWAKPGPGYADALTGVSATGHAECARLLIHFDGPAPGVQVVRTPLGNDTLVSLEGGVPDGPVSPDLVTPDLELLTAAFVTSEPGGAGVRVLHGDHRELAARVVPADGGIALYFREQRPEDARHEPVVGRRLDVSLAGQPEHGLVVLEVRGEASTGNVVVEGYAKAPESNVVIRVYDSRRAVVCSDHGLAHGPPFLFSRFTRSCRAGAGTYDVQVGWPDPSGTGHVWSEYEVTVG